MVFDPAVILSKSRLRRCNYYVVLTMLLIACISHPGRAEVQQNTLLEPREVERPANELLRWEIDDGHVSHKKLQQSDWAQWRGPTRSGVIDAATWPESLDEKHLKALWTFSLGPSYSGPIVVGDRVFTTETRDKKYEVVSAIHRLTGELIWTTQWEGSMSVPFFARENGDWIRSTPVFENGRLYVGGMQDVLVCLDADTGKQIWKFDFPVRFKSAVPTFGFVCSPLVDGDGIYVQAGAGFCKLKKATGELIWRTLEDGGGMNGSAFSSPIIAEICGVRQAVVQTRTHLCGVDLDSGRELWKKEIPTFRGMNILTPLVRDDCLFVSAYGGTTQLIRVKRTVEGQFSLEQQ